MYALALTAALTLASPPPDADEGTPDLPDAVEVLERARAALGTPERLASLGNVVARGTLRWEGMGGSGTIVESYAGLRRVHVRSEFEGFGSFEQGTLGELVWEKNPLGVTVRDGWHASEYLRRFAIAQHVDWRELYARTETVGEAVVDGRRCLELHLVPRPLVAVPEECADVTPPPDVWYVDAESHLLRRLLTRAQDPGSEPVEVRVDLDDWRAVDGVRHPHALRVEMSGFTLVVDYDSYEHGAELPADLFDAAADVLAAADRHQSGEQAAADDEVVVEALELRHIASIRVQCAHADMQKVLSVALPEAFQHVLSRGATVTGQPLVRYHSFGDTIDMEAAIPVAEPVEPGGRVVASTLPAGRGVVAWHVGPYERLGDTHERIQAYLDEHGLTPAGACWEEYWTDPGMEPDPEKWRTRVVWPVEAESD